MMRVKVNNPKDDWLGTEYYINGQKINNVRSVDFRVAVDEIPVFQFETMGLPDIDMSGAAVLFSFAPETVQEAAVVLRNEFMSNPESRKALISSIASALKEMPEEVELDDAAKLIANRIVDIER